MRFQRLARILFIVAVAATGQEAIGQQYVPNLGITMQGAGENAALTTHRSPLGKPCLNFEAASRPHVINPSIYDNVVSIQNECSIRIVVRVCYYGTESCIDVEVTGNGRKDAILGTRPNSQYFRYSYKEKF